MKFQPLIDATDLAAGIERAECVVVDCRFELQAPHKGFASYLAGHIPGARYAHLDKDLAAPVTPSSGRHPLPSVNDFAASLGAWGITAQTRVVAYDDAGGAIAARLWWMLRWLGHRDCAVLDGGIAAWRAAGLPFETLIPRWREAVYAPRHVRLDWVVPATEIENALARGACLLDARAAPRFRGDSEPIDPVAGHIPGARNLPFSDCLTAGGRFQPAERLAETLAAATSGVADGNVIAMCGSGVTACHLLLAMEAAGLGTGKLYVGSWSEWIRDPARPIASGQGEG
jgi:thiosulfate/3-mercaptopyruvate sulfurtransferase